MTGRSRIAFTAICFAGAVIAGLAGFTFMIGAIDSARYELRMYLAILLALVLLPWLLRLRLPRDQGNAQRGPTNDVP